MKKLKFALIALAMASLAIPADALAEMVGNDKWGYVKVYSGAGLGKAGLFMRDDGYRRIRFYNDTNYYINCKAQNHFGQWITTGSLPPGAFKDLGVGNNSGNWSCWYDL